MKIAQKRTIIAIAVPALLAAIFVVGYTLTRQKKGIATMGLIPMSIPSLKIGDWWVVRTHNIVDVSGVEHGPEKLEDMVYYHVYEVVSEQNINGKETWMIDVKATRIPRGFANDHGDNYLWRMYINKKDCTLVQLDTAIRGHEYLVTGERVKTRTYSFSGGNPVVGPIMALTPLDIPRLPQEGNFPIFLSEDEKEYVFRDERSNREYVQYIVALQEDIGNKTATVLYVTLYNEVLGMIITQKWVPGLPWWQEWRRVTVERLDSGIWSAELIEWGSGKKK